MNQLIGHNFWGMGCQINVWLDCDDLAAAQQTIMNIEALFQREEQRLSRFLVDSELSQLNRRPEAWVPVSEPLWRVIVRAIELAEETAGLFDPTLLPELEAAGYHASFEQLEPKMGSPLAGLLLADRLPRYERIGLDGETRSVWLPAGGRLDVGGIGKGATAETAVRTFCRDIPCLIDAGGDLTAGLPPRGWQGWPVGIKAPWSDDNLLRLWLANGSLATSGVDYRRWRQGAKQMHHIIDGRTGQPAETDLLTVSILSDDACRAEAWATALLVAGSALAAERVAEANLATCLIDDKRRVTLTPSLEQRAQREALTQI